MGDHLEPVHPAVLDADAIDVERFGNDDEVGAVGGNPLVLGQPGDVARAMYPSHTMGDGDTVFALATGRWDGEADVTMVGALAVRDLKP